MAKLDIRNLSISFRTNNGVVRAVRDVSFRLEEGETLAIAGESGSGKSVTARAVMGILAGNAMVDGGEIIYDGRDLLQIPEEDFHTLRGHRLSMVFQDPLSALNPVMRIGRQLTEAMILNNRERRRDGRARFNKTLKLLEQHMTAYALEKHGVSPKDTKDTIREFHRFSLHGTRREQVYENARAAMTEVTDYIDEIRLELAQGNLKAVNASVTRMLRAGERVYDDFLVTRGSNAYRDAITAVRQEARGLTARKADTFRDKLDALATFAEEALARQNPDFMPIGYCLSQHIPLHHDLLNIPEVNAQARRILEERFMNRFLDDIANALDHSRRKADERRIQAAVALERELPVFARDKLEKGSCKASAARLSAAVERAIDPLALRKDDRSYVFRSSLQTRIKRYFKGIKTNPAEAKRFARETALHAQKVQRGKFAASVPPINLIDTQKELDGIVASLEALRADFLSRPAGAGGGSAREQAAEMVRYLKERSSEYAFRMSKGLAKHRALSMMDEVGIPEPHRRFKQYPFELSGGMRQRIVIAIALSANPDILICDEPTTALDVTIQAQILELINNLKVNRRLSVIFITHDLGVVANMADKIAVMYAGRIVEYGTAEDIFYDPRHPYTWALLSSMPDLETREKLEAIPGTPPDMIYPPSGDAFAPRNHYALAIDFEEAPPFFRVSDTHMAATWLLHPDAPKVSPPPIVRERIERMQQAAGAHSSHLSAKEENGLENS